MVEISAVLPGSMAARRGLAPGDRLLTINGREVRDSIDFQFFAAEERLALLVQKAGGAVRLLRIAKDPDDTLGIELHPFTVRQCRNKCIFCFVDQMPPGCRRSLYIRDDDYRASFLYGNYITLSNLREADWERIFTQRLSPLYVSVHAADPDLRAKLMGSAHVRDIMGSLRRLASGGIRMHTQIVLCPGVNDGRHLERTLDALAGLAPSVLSIAVVPIGLTGFRNGLYRLRTFSRAGAQRAIATVRSYAGRFLRKFGTRLVFAADELYIRAGMDLPLLREYEDLPQIENGVGMVSQFLHEAGRTRLPAKVAPIALTMVTGRSFGPILSTVMQRLGAVRGVSLKIISAQNGLFGRSVTVAGLLGGSDILRAVKGKTLGDMLLVPAAAVKEDAGIFLDDMTLEELAAAAVVPVHPVASFPDVVHLLRRAAKPGFVRSIS